MNSVVLSKRLERAGHRPARPLPIVLVAIVAAGCGGASAGSGAADDGSLVGSRGSARIRRQCTARGTEQRTLDVNGDGRPDVVQSVDGDRLRCATYDLNFDGKVDVSRFYERDGVTVEQEEHDFDFDGRPDQATFYENGRVVRREIDTDFDSVIDAWFWCEEGLVVRAERARSRQGEPDTWEEYERGVLRAARYDRDGDGDVDKWETYEEGRLQRVELDTDGDGDPDRVDTIAAEDAGPAEDRLLCEPLTATGAMGPAGTPAATPPVDAAGEDGAERAPDDPLAVESEPTGADDAGADQEKP